ncbi:MAG TPA: hypothetical protein VJR89_40825 [Polyangiales bacterium]|nr:hypothetical protein [Polyangiales bacterium]
MLSAELRVTGFDSQAWARLLSLFGASAEEASAAQRGTLVVVVDPLDAPCAAFITQRGPVPIAEYTGRAHLAALCERLGAPRAIVVRLGAIEELTERAVPRVLGTENYAAQWLGLLSAMRELEREGALYFWPERRALPLPNGAVLARTVDTVLPDERALLAVLWEDGVPWTALLLRRRAGEIDLVAGPEFVLDVVGPLGGDYRRDHRAVSRAVSDAVAPVHIGIYAQRSRFELLLRNPAPGAWAKAVALRDIIIDPSPPYVHVALAADALRATARKTSHYLGGLDFLSSLQPAARYAREQVMHVASVTRMLGWNPLEVLASRLRTRADTREPR